MAMTNDDNETSIILNVDANMDNLKDYVGTSNILKSLNPPIPSRQLSSQTMSNFDAYEHRLKKNSTLAPFTAHCVGSVEDTCDGCIGSSM
jgi:hypothetical protein